jgi:hypothetical protein
VERSAGDELVGAIGLPPDAFPHSVLVVNAPVTQPDAGTHILPDERLAALHEVCMRYALISDIHSKLPALESILADVVGREDVDMIHHLGDLVAYAPWPNETVELLRERRIPGVSGNYYSTVATDYKHCGCTAESPGAEGLSHESYALFTGKREREENSSVRIEQEAKREFVLVPRME